MRHFCVLVVFSRLWSFLVVFRHFLSEDDKSYLFDFWCEIRPFSRKLTFFIKKYKKKFALFKYWLYLCFRDEGNTSHGQGRFLGNLNAKDMATLKYTTREINHNFKIKVYGVHEGKKVDTLVGVKGLLKMVNDVELCNRLLDRAFNCMGDKQVCKLRRGIRISFYYY